MYAYLTRLCALKSFLLSILTISYCIVIFFVVADTFAQTSTPRAEITKLENGKAVERPLAGGQAESFRLELTANQYANIDVEQRGIDVVVRLVDADGKPIIEFDDDPRTTGTESAEIAVREDATITLTVEPRQKAAPPGRFEIKFTKLRGAHGADRDLDDARRCLD